MENTHTRTMLVITKPNTKTKTFPFILSPEVFERLYEQTEYERGKPDIKHNHALEAIIQAAHKPTLRG